MGRVWQQRGIIEVPFSVHSVPPPLSESTFHNRFKKKSDILGSNVLTVFLPGFLEVSAHSAPGKLPICLKLRGVTFQEAKSKDPAQQEEAKSLIMREMTNHFVERHAAQIPSEEYGKSLYYYLKGAHDLMIREVGEGSLRIVVECRTVEILERLWDDYSSGHLNEVAEERLLTDEIKEKYEVESIELETTIIMEDYQACKLSLRGMSSYS